jgi:hypothetical protein
MKAAPSVFLCVTLLARALWPSTAGAAGVAFSHTSSTTFEGILTQTVGAVDSVSDLGAGAVHRGQVSLTITRRGAVSGRLRYNELVEGNGAATAFYKPVSRSFSGVLKPQESEPLRYSLCVPLTAVPAAGRPQLIVKADCSGGTPTVTVRVSNSLAQNGSGAAGAAVETPVLAEIISSALPEGLPGRFVLTSDAAYLLVQTLPGGRVTWGTRMPGYSNSGTGLASAIAGGGLAVAFYESRVTRSALGTATDSLVGTLNLIPPQGPDSFWRAAAGDSFFSEGLDWQSSLSAAASVDAAVGGAAGAPVSQPYCERGVLEFSSSMSSSWTQRGEVLSGLAALFARGPALFSLQDHALTDADGNPTVHSWNVSYGPKGFFAAGISNGGAFPPPLWLRVASDRGELTGSVGGGASGRRQIKGSILLTQVTGTTAAGWVEPAPNEFGGFSLWNLRPGGGAAARVAAASAPASSPAAAPAVTAAVATNSGSAASEEDHQCVPPLISPPPLIQPPPLIPPPPLIDPPPLIPPPPLIDPPPLIQPPPLIDPPPLIQPPPLIDPPPLIPPPPLIDPPPLILPPPLIGPPPLIPPPPLC